MLNHVSGGIRKVYNTAKYNQPARDMWEEWGATIAATLESPASGNIVQFHPAMGIAKEGF